MASTKYSFSIAGDTANGLVDSTSLTTEIQASSILTALDYIETVGDVLDIWFKAALSTSNPDDEANLTAVVAAHTGTSAAQSAVPVQLSAKTTDDNRIRVAIEKSDLSSTTFYSFNFCDKTTWWEKAMRVVDEVATDSGDQLTYNVAQTNLIDVYHGKITDEDDLLDSGDNSYRVVVKINDVVKTERDPHENHMGNTTHGDYVVDYVAGTITFHSALQGGDIVKVTYHYATTSVFTITPKAGKRLQIETVEAQFSNDVGIRDTALFTTFGYVDVFAPALVNNPYPSGTRIPIRTKKYKSMQNYQDDAMRAYPQVPALGGVSWRGLEQPVQIFDWDYQRGLVLHDTYGMMIEISMEHDEAFSGTYATVTLYCATEDDGV